MLASSAKKNHAEVKVKDLTLTEKHMLTQAKNKEISAWLETKTVKQKNAKTAVRGTDHAHTLGAGKIDPQTVQSIPKASLVVLGYHDPALDTAPNDAPTLQRRA